MTRTAAMALGLRIESNQKGLLNPVSFTAVGRILRLEKNHLAREGRLVEPSAPSRCMCAV
jgi:hypothetical protein